MKREERKEGKKRRRTERAFYTTCALMRTRNSFEWNKNYPSTDISGPRERAGLHGERRGGGEGSKMKNPAEWRARETLFSTSIYAHVPCARERARWIKLGILRKERRDRIFAQL